VLRKFLKFKFKLILIILSLFLYLEFGILNPERAKYGIASGDPFLNQVVLTFDDGPREHGIQELLSAMKDCDVHATFFLVGKFAEICARCNGTELWKDGIRFVRPALFRC